MSAASADGGTPVQDLRVVVTHDFMETYGGAERVTAEIAAAFPEAPVFAIAGRREVARRMGVEERFTSLLTPRRRLLSHYRLLAPVYPAIVSRLRLPDADVVVSSSYGFAHRLGTENGAVRVCYAHSPLRFAWSMPAQYRQTWASGPISGRAFDLLAASMRASDRRSAKHVFRYLAPGENVARQVREYYGRRADVVGPPVDCGRFRPGGEPVGDYFLFAGRLIEPYKRVKPLVEAFNRLGERLLIAGDGPARSELEAIAGPNVELLGQLDDSRLIPLMQRCKAAVFPSEDDFGLVPLEVNACGRPVIAYKGGGALDTVSEGITGEFFADQTPDAIEASVAAFDPAAYEGERLRRHAQKWDRGRFRDEIVAAVRLAVEDSRAGNRTVPQ